MSHRVIEYYFLAKNKAKNKIKKQKTTTLYINNI